MTLAFPAVPVQDSALLALSAKVTANLKLMLIHASAAVPVPAVALLALFPRNKNSGYM